MVSLGTQPANRKSGFGHSSPTGARAQDLSRQPARPDLWGLGSATTLVYPTQIGCLINREWRKHRQSSSRRPPET